MLRWPRNPKDPIQPGLAEKWEFKPDGTELTLTLRKGLKWSDGEPFTTDDILFWWNDIALDTNIYPAPPPEWVINGKPMAVEASSPEVVKLKFNGPNGMALRMLAFHGNQWPLNFERFGFYAPKHYLKQFHPKYNNVNAQQLTVVGENIAFDKTTLSANATAPITGDLRQQGRRRPAQHSLLQGEGRHRREHRCDAAQHRAFGERYAEPRHAGRRHVLLPLRRTPGHHDRHADREVTPGGWQRLGRARITDSRLDRRTRSDASCLICEENRRSCVANQVGKRI